MERQLEKPKKTSINFSELIYPIFKNWIIVLIAFISVVTTVIILNLTSSPVYEASATIMINGNGNLSSQMFTSSEIFMKRYLVKNQVAILKSRHLASVVIQKLLQSVWRDSMEILSGDEKNRLPSLQELTTRFQNATSVSYGVENDIINLKGRASNPREAAALVNTWIDLYQDYDFSKTHGEVIETKHFLEKKLKDIELKLSDSENALATYQKQNNVVSLPKKTEELVTQLVNFESLYNQTKAELEATENELSYLNDQLDENKKYLVDNMVNTSNSVLQELQRQMAELVVEKAAYEAQLLGAGYATASDIKLKQMENRLKGVREKIVDETKKLVNGDLTMMNPLNRSEKLITDILRLQTTRKSLEAKENILKEDINEYNKKLTNLPDKNRELVRLEREVQVNTNIYVMIREKYEETRIRESGQAELIRVIDRAEPPMSPISPKVKLNLILGCFFGMLLGICLVSLKEYFADTINSRDELEKMGLKVLGSVPHFKQRSYNLKCFIHRKKSNQKKFLPFSTVNDQNNLAFGEAYRTIRTALSFQNHSKKLKTILVTSPGPSEGKSTTVTNLAIASAQKNTKTLIIDSDLRRPVLHTYFTATKNNHGFSNFLEKSTSWRRAIVKTDLKFLFFLCAGQQRDDAAELLCQRKLKTFIRELKKSYEYVFFDSPPLLPVTDSTILASLVDGVILVVKFRQTEREAVIRSIELLKNVNANLLGIVFVGSHDYKKYRKYNEYYRFDYMQKQNQPFKLVVGGKY